MSRICGYGGMLRGLVQIDIIAPWRAFRGLAAVTAWTVVIPIKRVAHAKSRLRPLDSTTRAALARAFAFDTVEAALGAQRVRRVIVVGRPDELTTIDPRVEVVREPAEGHLDAAIDAGVAHARRVSLEPTAVMLGDLPALAAADLDRGLDEAARHPLAFVADIDGSGTTLATANVGQPLRSHFGPGSAVRHRRAGFIDLAATAPAVVALGLRTDADTLEDLEAVMRIGPALRTATALRLLARDVGGPLRMDRVH